VGYIFVADSTGLSLFT